MPGFVPIESDASERRRWPIEGPLKRRSFASLSFEAKKKPTRL